MKYAHTPTETSPSSLPPRSDPVSKKPTVTKTSSTATATQGRKDAAGDGGDESEEERERRLHELQEQASIFVIIRTWAGNSGNVLMVDLVLFRPCPEQTI